MRASTERSGGAQNKEVRPQAKNKLNPRLVGYYCSAPGLRLAYPRGSVHLPYATTDGERANWDFFASLFPRFPPLTPFPHHKQSPNKAPIPTASPAPCSQQKRDAKPRLESDSPALNAALPAKCDLKAPLSQLQSSEQPFLG